MRIRQGWKKGQKANDFHPLTTGPEREGGGAGQAEGGAGAAGGGGQGRGGGSQQSEGPGAGEQEAAGGEQSPDRELQQ